METITREYKVFNFEELSEEAKEKVIENHYIYEHEYGYNFLEMDIKEELKQLDQCFLGASIAYSLSYCQGDGLEEIKTYYIDLCYKLEKYGYSIFEYRMNNEEMNKLCQSNEYIFFEDGTMCNL